MFYTASCLLSELFFLVQSIGSNVLQYVNMVCATLRNSIPKSIVYCQVREAKRTLLDHFFTELGKKDVSTLVSFILTPAD